ncbi:MAG: SH3 domain-containing protein [Planctomycetota bacterium]|nr:SH3 domain-containing protein [Planctomycetota bacterium]
MLRPLLLVLAFFALVCDGLASDGLERDPSADHAAAVEAYRAGDHATARTLWEGLLAEPSLSDAERARVSYDLGNLAFRGERFLEAVARYHATIELSPRHADAWHNLELARSRAGLEAADRGDLAATIERLLAAPTETELARASWLLLALLLLAIAWEIRRGGLLPKLAAWGLFGLLVAGLGLAFVRDSNALERPAMVVASGGAPLRAEPDRGLEVTESLAPGERVEVLDQLGIWTRVRSGDATGWLEADRVLELFGPTQG